MSLVSSLMSRMPLPRLLDSYHDLATAISGDLERTCPALSDEQRMIFAVQIALAELRTLRGDDSAGQLRELGDDN